LAEAIAIPWSNTKEAMNEVRGTTLNRNIGVDDSRHDGRALNKERRDKIKQSPW
jgi:hypothetical protein